MNYNANILNNTYLEYYKVKNFYLHLIFKMESTHILSPLEPCTQTEYRI